MRVSVVVRTVLIALSLTAALLGLGVSAAARAAGGPLSFHPRWQVVARGGVASDGPYTMLWSQRPGVAGTLVDELTGRHTQVRLPVGCPAPVGGQALLGDTWLIVACAHSRVDLYALATGVWKSLALPAVCRHAAGKGPSCLPADVGTNWIKYDEASVKLGDRWLFQNIVTGAVRNDPTNAHTLPDLDSPLLTEAICAPLRVPSDKTQDTLQLDGRFAVLRVRAGIFLEHCGAHLHRPIADDAPWVTVGPQEIMWSPRPTHSMQGIFLPSRRRFSVAIPGGASIQFLAIAARHLYVIGLAGAGTTAGSVGVVWSAPLPALGRT